MKSTTNRLHSRALDIKGQKYGKWTVITLSEKRGKLDQLYWVCRCDCGVEREISSASLRNGKSKSCGCNFAFSVSLPPFAALYKKFKYHALYDRKIEFDISYIDFFSFTFIKECHYCRAKIKWTANNLSKHGARFNLDRKDNTRGYVLDNVVVCCKFCNRAKRDIFTYEQFIEIGKLIQRWRTENGISLSSDVA